MNIQAEKNIHNQAIQINRPLSVQKWVLLNGQLTPSQKNAKWIFSKVDQYIICRRFLRNRIIYKLHFTEYWSGSLFLYATINHAIAFRDYLGGDLQTDSSIREDINTLIDEMINPNEYCE